MTVLDGFGGFRQNRGESVVKWRHFAAGAAILALAVILTGCAGGPGGRFTANSPAADKEAAVKERAEARWKLLLAGDYDQAYGYLSPASREVATLAQWKGKLKLGNIRDVKVDSVACEAETCSVKLMITYDHRLMQGIVTPAGETWVLDGGQFWFVNRG